MTKDRTGPVAIVGVAHRLPGPRGESLSSHELWQALLERRDLVSQVQTSRWSQDPYLHARRGEPGSTVSFAAGSVGDVSLFDAAFFGISPREAAHMDPQQRLLLEMTWEAFEDAGIVPAAVRGARWGVFVGLSSLDYAYRLADDLAAFDASTMTGSAASIAPNRISFAFDLRGPSLALDTACSSSIVALHQARRSIESGECEAAVVGGVSLHLHPYGFVGFSKASMLAADGRCRPFDAAGQGYVRSEGGAVVLLKPLGRALADGDRVLAVIAATVVNTDGHKNGLTVPSCEGQTRLLREAYAEARIEPAEIDYLEAHGTGTAVGDPIEARAIGEALGRQRPPGRALPIGSVKSNLGHLEAAAGMASLVKVLLAIRHRRVPATIHLAQPNPQIPFEELNLTPVGETLILPEDRRVVLGINSFGFGGANAHAVLASWEDGPAPTRCAAPHGAAAKQAVPPMLLSARSPQALRALAGALGRHLRDHPDDALYDVAWNLAFRREAHAHRLLAVAQERGALIESLERFCAQGDAPDVSTGHLLADASRPAFVYSGNGAQWAGMGRRLMECDAEFRAGVEEVDALIAGHAGPSIVEELLASGARSRLEFTEVAQPALFAIQVGLTRSLRARGIHPAAVCGHSVGEVAAAWACGALSLIDAARLVFERSRQQARTKGAGRMSAVAHGATQLQGLIGSLGLEGDLVVAGINSARSSTVAGRAHALAVLETELTSRRVGFKRLALDYAFHAPTMDSVREDLVNGLAALAPRPALVPFYSTVTGGRLEGGRLDGVYWWRNVREPVRFAEAIAAMMAARINVFIEIGPDAILQNYLGACIKEAAQRDAGGRALALPTMKRTESRADPVGRVLRELLLAGAPVDTSGSFPRRARLVELPRYPWQRERHWAPQSSESLGLLARRIVHPLLGYAVAGADLVWENHLDTERQPWLADHAVDGAAVFPAAGFAEMALAAARERDGPVPARLEDLEIAAPMLLARDRSRTTRLQLDPQDGRFTITSRERLSTSPWVVHATGRLLAAQAPTSDGACALVVPDDAIPGERHYAVARALGLQYGPAFQSVVAAWGCGDGIYARLATPAAAPLPASGTVLHPALLDGALQLLADLLVVQPDARCDVPAYLPVRFSRLQVFVPGQEAVYARARVLRRGPRSLVAEFAWYGAKGEPLALAQDVRFRAAMRPAAAQRSHALLTHAVPAPRRSLSASSELPATEVLAACCASRLHGERRAARRMRYAAEVEPLLDMLCVAFAERALRALNAGGGVIEPAQWLASGAVAPDAQALLGLLLQILEEHGTVKSSGGRWVWQQGADLPRPEQIWASLVFDYPDFAALAGRVGSAGLRLAEHLRSGRADDPVEVSAAPWTETCTRHDGAAILESTVDVLSCAIDAQGEGARLRALCFLPRPEIDRFARMCRRLDWERCGIIIAAPDEASREATAALLRSAPGLESRVVSLDGPDAPDAAELGGFDILMLGEGLALAPDPLRRLANARTLLADGGLLLALEQQPSRPLDFVHGFAPRWWASAAEGDIARSRLRSARDWGALLARSGFGEVEAIHDVPADAGTDAADIGPCLMLARVLPRPSEQTEAESLPSRCWIVLADEAGYSAALAGELEDDLATAGQRTVAVVAGGSFAVLAERRYRIDPASGADWTRLLDALRAAHELPDGWVHLAGLDLGSAHKDSTVRLAAQAARATALLAWLQASAQGGVQADCWLVAAHAGVPLLKSNLRTKLIGRQRPMDLRRDAALLGVARVAVNEYPERRIRWIDVVDPEPAIFNAPRIAREMLEPDAEDEIILAHEGRFAPRLREAPLAAAPKCAAAGVRLELPLAASIRNLTWRRFEGRAPGPGEVEIEVRAAGLNFRDVMYAMGLLPDEALESGFSGATLGMELSGVLARVGEGVRGLAPGDAVLAFAPAAFANRVVTSAAAVMPKPPQWSFEAAATVPTAFVTAWYALAELARVREGERVLVHGAAGGVGIAAIQVARHLGAEVFATAGTAEKRDLVRLLGASQVFDSRSLAFADEILQATGGQGVDVILNSIAGEAARRNLTILRPFGRLLELGKRDFYENARLALRPFRNNISYFGIDADQLMSERPDLARRLLAELMKLFTDGTLRPLPFEVYGATEIEAAFACMRDSRHTGKIVVAFDPGAEPVAESVLPTARVVPAADATYLVTGGLTGFGLRSAQWLAARGARHLALLSRRGADTPGASEALAAFAAQGVTALALSCDVADAPALAEALARVRRELPPLRGVIHAAMTMEDAYIRDCDAESFARVLAPKATGAANLDMLTREDKLEFFLLYSSATTLFGNPGQAKYVASNCALEALAHERRAAGLPATCVLWGPIADAGYLAANEPVRNALTAHLGAPALAAESALGVLDRLLCCGTGTDGNPAVFDVDWATLARHLPAARSPRFADLARRRAPGGGMPGGTDLRAYIASLAPTELEEAIESLLAQEVGAILQIAPERIDPAASLYEIGMDSLMALELGLALDARLGIRLPNAALAETPTLERLAQRLARLLRPEEPEAATNDLVAPGLRALAAQHAGEASEEWLAELSTAVRTGTLHEAGPLTRSGETEQAQGHDTVGAARVDET